MAAKKHTRSLRTGHMSVWIRLVAVLFAVGLDALATGILIPVVQLYMTQDVGLTVAQWGHCRSLGGISQLVGAAAASSLSDFVGRRSMITLAYASVAASYGTLGLATSMPSVAFFAHAALGLGGYPKAIAHSIVCDLTTPGQDRAFFIGIMGAVFSGAMIFGPPLGGQAGSKRRVIIAAACLQACASLMTLCFFHETLPSLRQSDDTDEQRNSVSTAPSKSRREDDGSLVDTPLHTVASRPWQDRAKGGASEGRSIGRTPSGNREVAILLDRRAPPRDSVADDALIFAPSGRELNFAVTCIALARFLQTASVQTITVTYTLFIHAQYQDLDVTKAVGMAMAFYGGVMSLVHGVVYRWMYRLFGPFGTMYISLMGLSLGLFATYFSTQFSFWIHVMFVALIYTPCYALSEAGMPNLISLYAKPTNQGFTQGILAFSHSSAKIASPSVYATLFQHNPAFSFFAAAACALTGIPPLMMSHWQMVRWRRATMNAKHDSATSSREQYEELKIKV